VLPLFPYHPHLTNPAPSLTQFQNGGSSSHKPNPKGTSSHPKNIYQDADYLLVADNLPNPLPFSSPNIPSVSSQHSISQPIKNPPSLLQSSFAAPYLPPSLPYPEPPKPRMSILHPPKHPRPTKIFRGPPFANLPTTQLANPSFWLPIAQSPSHPSPYAEKIHKNLQFRHPHPTSHYHDSSSPRPVNCTGQVPPLPLPLPPPPSPTPRKPLGRCAWLEEINSSN
jgi:hypothetical protein